ncbi:alpha/beta hydrolase [Chelativorans salis]|uniref:Alpha/beta hydrolase n=1 Tax=Chelativorans salis TaxID=2978478 RepID=A0ABT2LU49_9HYPH|nr:alpha/beta hydrolase [Chelativorans sp. EGI FJ00035]MCT7378060.1 alpha/beta hydrolase [Chelativorans sp. EGI FJ00035]
MEKLGFEVDGETVIGHLELPEGASAADPVPALVFTGPFTGTKEQVTGTYARFLAKEGFATLAFDHRNFGESGGRIRQHEAPYKKLDDLAAATSYLAARPEVDAQRIGAVGICLGGSFALHFAAFDPRIRALATVAAAYLDARPASEDAAVRKTEWFKDYARELALFHEGTPTRIKAVTKVDGEAAGMPGQEPFDYYGTDRAHSPHWKNEITRLSSYNLARFDAVLGADYLAATPTLVVHGTTDLYCSPEAAARIFERINGTKRIEWIETTNHIELYDSQPHVSAAVAHVSNWMKEHLYQGAGK